MVDLASLIADLTFYRQARRDGGVRTGIMIGERTVLGRFDRGNGDNDPILIWAVDLRCDGPNLPREAEVARSWLLDHERMIREGFAQFADDLMAGADVDPLEWSGFTEAPEGIEMKIVCRANRRVDALGLAAELRDIGGRWREIIEGLPAPRPVSSW